MYIGEWNEAAAAPDGRGLIVVDDGQVRAWRLLLRPPPGSDCVGWWAGVRRRPSQRRVARLCSSSSSSSMPHAVVQVQVHGAMHVVKYFAGVGSRGRR
jgi:hypothetical protein